MFKLFRGYITFSVLAFIFLISLLWYFSSAPISEAEKIENKTNTPYIHTGKYILVHLDTMNIDLKNGSTTTITIPIVSKGKPASYYETIGGYYENDYKEPLHFSSIGHVYMPYSVHIFGNFFLHGIPYYEDGTKVSSSYSGGCIRLEDNDAKIIYDFIESGTPIIITQDGEYDFNKSSTTTPDINSIEMTNLMTAMISLEFLTQDNEIIHNNASTTRRTLIPQLLQNNDTNISLLYARAFGERLFIENMNKKAKAIGLTNTIFTNVNKETLTTKEDYEKFMKYISTYKSYLTQIIDNN